MLIKINKSRWTLSAFNLEYLPLLRSTCLCPITDCVRVEVQAVWFDGCKDLRLISSLIGLHPSTVPSFTVGRMSN